MNSALRTARQSACKSARESTTGSATLGAVFASLMLATTPATAGAGAGTAEAGPRAETAGPATPTRTDHRLREVVYDPQAVVTVPVRRGIVTLVLLDADESITELASGLGGDCAKPDAAWCIAAQPGGRTVFVKPKSSAAAPNNLAIVTSQRIHNLRFDVLADDDPRPSLYRLAVSAPRTVSPLPRSQAAVVLQAPQLPALPSPEQLVSERLRAKPAVLNTQYALAEGADSQDIVPTLVFDDGRFTYLRLPGNRDIPAVFQVLGDGSEALVNARMEDELLVVDRVSRRLMLRAGSAVVGLWNEAFNIEGVPSDLGTTVPGVRRALKSNGAWPPPAVAHSPAAAAAQPRLLATPQPKRAHEHESQPESTAAPASRSAAPHGPNGGNP